MRQRSLARRLRLVKLLGIGSAGDPKIFDAHGLALAGGLNVRPNVVRLGFPSEVAVEIAIEGIGRKTGDRAPDLLRTTWISPKSRHAGQGVKRSVHVIEGSRRRIENSVCFHEKEARTRGRDQPVQSRIVAALGEPNAAGRMAEHLFEMPYANRKLRPDRGWHSAQQGQKPMGGARSDQLEDPFSSQGRERSNQIAPVMVLKFSAQMLERVLIELRQAIELGVGCGSMHLLPGQLAESVDPSTATLHQQLVLEHRQQSGRDAERQANGKSILRDPLEHPEQRQIRLEDRLVEPVFLQKIRLVRVADEGQVSVQNEGETSPHRLEGADCSALGRSWQSVERRVPGKVGKAEQRRLIALERWRNIGARNPPRGVGTYRV